MLISHSHTSKYQKVSNRFKAQRLIISNKNNVLKKLKSEDIRRSSDSCISHTFLYLYSIYPKACFSQAMVCLTKDERPYFT